MSRWRTAVLVQRSSGSEPMSLLTCAAEDLLGADGFSGQQRSPYQPGLNAHLASLQSEDLHRPALALHVAIR